MKKMPLKDIFKNNLRGRDYIQARGLSPDVVLNYNHTCGQCQRNAMLPAVMRIIAGWGK